MSTSLIEIYQKYCKYSITDSVQQLDFSVDIDRLRQEIFNFIASNQFGFNSINLRLPENNVDYVDQKNENLYKSAVESFHYLSSLNKKFISYSDETLSWHPNLENSYVAHLVPELEKLVGFKIGRVRLIWLLPNAGYPMHYDFEPMRFHIPLLTNKEAYFIHSNKLYHMEYGKLYHIITSGIHTAWNFGVLPRLHLMFSTCGDEIVDENLEKLLELSNLQKNFLNTVANNEGVDELSLSYLIKIQKSSSQRNSVDVDQLIYESRFIIDLLKNKKN